jgi:hypothetical protein
MRELFNHLSALGIKKNLNFSSCEFLKDALIGLDTTNRKLLIIRGMREARYEEVVVNLDEVKSCSLKKVYGSIKAGDLKKRKLEQLLDKISLYFEFHGDKDPVEVPFFEYLENNASDRSELNKKAGHWGLMLSAMLKSRDKEIAQQ